VGNRLPVDKFGDLLEEDALGLSFLYIVVSIAQGLGSFDRHTSYRFEVID
jgi:hypothetical protein